MTEQQRPAVLVSFVYVGRFIAKLDEYECRAWALDSGAFSAYRSGKEVALDDYIYCCKALADCSFPPAEVFALDVIGDWKASLKNTETMWKSGVEAIPCFHSGEPWDVLTGLCRDYPKVAIGGCARVRGPAKDHFAGQCFARVWPKRIHGFGFGAEKSMTAVPWHSVDSTSWELRPCGFGTWASLGHPLYGRQYLNTSAVKNLRAEVQWHMDLEARVKDRWAGEMAKLGEGSGDAPTLYLGLGFVREDSVSAFKPREGVKGGGGEQGA